MKAEIAEFLTAADNVYWLLAHRADLTEEEDLALVAKLGDLRAQLDTWRDVKRRAS